MSNLVRSNSITLKRVLGVAFGISIVIGGTIGAGILRTPGSIAALLPNKTLILSCWLLTGLYILLCASSYAELTTMLPKAGGAFNYIKRAFGSYPGFVTGWFDFILNIIAPAFFCVVLGEYSGLLIPQLKEYSTPVALAFLTIFTLINLPGTRTSSTTQQIASVVKVVLLLILVAGCFLAQPLKINMPAVTETKLVGGGLLIAFFKAMQLILSTYDGWTSVSFFAEEDQDPGKNIPRSYFIGALSIILIYMLINAALLYVLPVSSIANNPLAASTAAALAFGSWSSAFINIVAIFTVISILNAYMLIPPRILYGISREGFFVRQGTLVNKGGTPYFSMMTCYALTFFLIVTNTYEQLFALGAVMLTVVTACSFASLLRLRRKEPDLPRPYKAWGYPYITILALAITVILFIGFAFSDYRSLLIVTSIFLASYPFYLLINRIKKQN